MLAFLVHILQKADQRWRSRISEVIAVLLFATDRKKLKYPSTCFSMTLALMCIEYLARMFRNRLHYFAAVAAFAAAAFF